MTSSEQIRLIDRRVRMAAQGTETIRATIDRVRGTTATVRIGRSLLPAIVPALPVTLAAGMVVELQRPRGTGGQLQIARVLGEAPVSPAPAGGTLERVFDNGPLGVRVHFGGVLRNADDGLGWKVHDNGTHSHHGIQTPEVIVPGVITDRDHGYLRVPLLPVGMVGGETVTGYGAVTGDETMAGGGVFVGVSGSYDELRVYFWIAQVVAGVYSIVAIGPNNPLVKGPTCNLWCTWTQFVEPPV